ncbi:MAG TPA: SDR family oxidoreductase [Azospirillaceae bacterium]|nr:SDR family oxidoreductase [Azospirillaceae bacterium]
MTHGNPVPAGPGRLFAFGLGYSALALALRLLARGWQVSGTSRDPERLDFLADQGIRAVPFDRDRPVPAIDLAGTTHLLVSIPPEEDGDPVLAAHADALKTLPDLAWVGLLSTTGVYGDQDGGWVDERALPVPGQLRSIRRLLQEDAWRATGLPVHVFRLAGIYGPGRSAVDEVRAGRARRVDKPGQVFSRIHVDDLAAVLLASMARPNPGAVYNVADDEPAPSHEVVAYACGLLGVEPPPLVPIGQAGLSPMAASFYAENRRVRNTRIKEELGVALAHPTYREGLKAQVGSE